MRRFNDAFGPFGFQPKAIKPSYGLAEATLFVSTTPSSEEPTIISVDRDELNAGRFVPVPDDSPKAVAQAGCRQGRRGEWAVIVDYDSASELPDGEIGEIWISGQNMGTGYWNKPEETVSTFRNVLKSRTSPRTPRVPLTTPPGCAPGTSAPTTVASSISRAAPRTWSSSTAATTTRRIRVLRPGVHQSRAHRFRRSLLGAGQPVARRGVRQCPRRSQT